MNAIKICVININVNEILPFDLKKICRGDIHRILMSWYI
jgi:hypothetical protein